MLCGSDIGQELLKDRWDFFAPLIEEKPELLSLACTGEGEDKGTTPFYLLCSSDIGIDILTEYKDFFYQMIKQNSLLLGSENDDQSVASILKTNPEGKAILQFFMSQLFDS